MMAPSTTSDRPWRARLKSAVELPDVTALDQTFVDMVRTMQPSIVTDIGSRDGEMAVRCRDVLRDEAQVFAFEANPENFFEFAEAASRRGVVFVPLAVGANRGSVQMKVPHWASAEQNASRQFRGIGSTRSRAGEASHLSYDAASVPLGEFFCLQQHREA